MAIVMAAKDLYTTKGKLLVAKRGHQGTALRMPTVRDDHVNKVAVRWDGRQKVYWHYAHDLVFVKSDLAPEAYIALPMSKVLDLPPIPQKPGRYSYDFGANLRQFRREMGISQRELAVRMRKLGVRVAQTTVSYWERSVHSPNGIYLRGISEVLKKPPFLFFMNTQDCEWMRRTRIYINEMVASLCEGTH